jgi:hypothetical protein
MQRPEYCPRAAKIGLRAEQAFHDWLHKMDFDHTWNNEESESHLIDFIVHLPDNISAGMEVESKDVKYRHLFEQGLDFIAAKVDKYLEIDELSYYVLVLSDLSGFYTIAMSDILVVGELINKRNRRNWNGEMFYRVPLSECTFKEL